ncbi:MAG: hypothetical protein K2G64_00060, partial [Muribaculaceae bacterium]|nr:hypothetical protein [Muribaculaceae bacterium]
ETNITEFFDQIISQSGSYDIAEAEFKRLLADDPELKAEYSEWCETMSYTERMGFAIYCQEHHDNQGDVWESLNDFDE